MDTSALAILDHSSTSDSAGSAITVGHVPHLILTVCSIFIRRGGTIVCVVTGPRQYSSDLPQGGLEIPCRCIFRTKDCALREKAKKVAQEIYSVLSVSRDANGSHVDGPHAAGAVGDDQGLPDAVDNDHGPPNDADNDYLLKVVGNDQGPPDAVDNGDPPKAVGNDHN